jgi:hypothetical protein
MSAGGTVQERWRVAVAVMVFTGVLAFSRERSFADWPSDLDQLLHAARALRAGLSPYEAVGPEKEFPWAWPVFYPLPAILLVLPLSFLKAAFAHCTFSVLAGGVLGFAMGARWRILWPLFLSEAYFLAITRNQWSPFVLAAIWLPAFGVFLSAKPNIGLAGIAGQSRNTVFITVGLAVTLLVVSFAIRPSWFGEWWALAAAAPNKEIALLQPGGLLLLGSLALLRTMEGRILFAMAIIPQTPSVYDLLLLFAICQSLRQALLLSILTHALQWSVVYLGPHQSFDAYYDSLAQLSVWIVHIPAMSIALLNSDATQRRVAASKGKLEHLTRRIPRRVLDHSLFTVLLFSFALNTWILFL